ncbi:MAG: OmpA family protein [Pirellulales bacterium]
MRPVACRYAVCLSLLCALFTAGCRNGGSVAGLPPFARGPYAANPNGDGAEPNQFDRRLANDTRKFGSRVSPLPNKSGSLAEDLKNARAHARLQDEHLRAVNERLRQAAAQLAQLQGKDTSGQSRADSLDRVNQEKERRLAAARQDVQRLETQLSQLRNQLEERNAELAKARASQERLVSNRARGNVSITPNAGSRLPLINVPNVQVRRDGDVVRIQISADQLFNAGTVQLIPSGRATLQQVAAAISRTYAKQRIGIEGHTAQASVGGPWRDGHHLSSAQAMAVYELLSRQPEIAANQLHITGHGANHSVYSSATPAGQRKNQRVEIVVYPETL